MRNFTPQTFVVTSFPSLIRSRNFFGWDSRLTTVSRRSYSFKCTFSLQQCSEAFVSIKTRTGVSESLQHLECGTLLQFRKPEDDWLHWGILFSREKEKYRLLSLEGRVYEVPSKQVHPLQVVFSFENDPILDITKVSDIFVGRKGQIIIKDSSLERFFQLSNSKFLEVLSNLREMIESYVLFLNKRDVLVSSNPCRSLHHGKSATSHAVQESLLSKEQKVLKDEITRVSGKSFEEALRALERNCLRLIDKQRAEDPLAVEILRNLGRSVSPMASFHLLMEAGFYSYYENLFLRASRFAEGFSEDVLKAGDEVLLDWNYLVESDDKSLCRIDLMQCPCFSIDDSDTIEVDDAVSLDVLNDEYVWVHVADPSAYIPFENVLLNEALRRGSSIYLPNEKIGMFPMNISELLLSLGSRYGLNCALSFGFRILPDGKLQDIQICKSNIKVPTRMNYETADKVIDGDIAESSLTEKDRTCLQRLYVLAKRRREYRLTNGAVEFNLNETEMKVKFNSETEPSFHFRIHAAESKSALLVKEMMLAAGEAVAIYAQQKEWILPYRGQDKTDLPSDLNAIPEGVARTNKLLKSMKASFISYRPVGHSSLGLPFYIQVTSPIRRATDLLAHYQISNYLSTDMPLMSVERLSSFVKLAQEGAKEAKIVEKRSVKYWCLEYLRKNGIGKSYTATVVSWIKSEEPKRILVQIDNIPCYFMLECENVCHPGHQINVKVTDIHPRMGTIRLTIV